MAKIKIAEIADNAYTKLMGRIAAPIIGTIVIYLINTVGTKIDKIDEKLYAQNSVLSSNAQAIQGLADRMGRIEDWRDRQRSSADYFLKSEK